ncbi:MAG: hypothetical protein RIT43_1197 [Bacteroidota bacterium]|jgi:predicted Rossmann fold flavoprotein
MKIGVIGGGAAGFFAAISAGQHNQKAEITILERSSKFLSKVKISGGGRCNVTNACFDQRKLAAHYPRGEHFLRKAFSQFDAKSTMDWFESRGVKLTVYPDNCVFPRSNTSQTVIDCFLNECLERKILLRTGFSVSSIRKSDDIFTVTDGKEELYFDKIIVTIGGQPKRTGFLWLEDLGLEVSEPVPSLFTFNMPEHPVRSLMGTVIPSTTVRVEGSKLTGNGPLLITHWGMSGPAVLQLSAWGARELYEKKYHFSILVNWLDALKLEEVQVELLNVKSTFPERKLINHKAFPLTSRLWEYLLVKSELHPDTYWKDLSQKKLNKLANTLINDRYEVLGKTTFKEEFVTAGGVALSEIDVRTMESKNISGLFFAGEVLDIDGITGGFNFQAAWTTAYIAGKSAAG